MARIRTIKPEFWESEKLGRLSIDARLNFLGLISMADDAGRGRGSAVWLINRLHPYDFANRSRFFERSLAELEHAGLVLFYEVEGCKYYCVKNFLEHQRIEKPKKSQIPPPPVPDSLPTDPGNVPDPSTTNPGGNGMEGNGSRKGMEWSGTEVERNGMDQEGRPGGGSATATPPRTRAGPEETERLRMAAKAKLGLTP